MNDTIGKMDLVIQGPLNNYSIEIANLYLQLDFVDRIILSTWVGTSLPENLDERIIVILNEDVSHPGIANRNRQIISSLNGLKQVKTKFSAKLRSCQKISLDSMYLMYEYYNKNKERVLHFEKNEIKPYNRICVAGIFRPFPFHPRDHIFWGNTLDLIDVFDIPLDTYNGIENYNLITRTEAYIASFYYAKFNNKIHEFIDDYKTYLVDDAPRIEESFKINDEIITKVFLPFPKINFEWPKHNLKTYHYDFTEKYFGEYWGEEMK
jgi:hypothetical protein